ncbi:MAG: hypothetical protein J0L61_11485 [Planctomycetes bacterium]|nr:hypothetical protein [Planctomycetota bacterium]
MSNSPLDGAIAELGPVPAAFHFANHVAYGQLRTLIRSVEGFSQYSQRTFRSLVHDHTWVVARQLLAEHPDCAFVQDSGTEVLRVGRRHVIQIHKIDELRRISDNGTARSLEIQGQGYLWQIGAAPIDGDIWLTIGHQPNPFTNAPESIVIGVALEDGMTEFRHVDPDVDTIAALGPQAADTVRRLRDLSA